MNYQELYADRLPRLREEFAGIQNVRTPQPEYHSDEERRAALWTTVRSLPVVDRESPTDEKPNATYNDPFRANQDPEQRQAASKERVARYIAQPLEAARRAFAEGNQSAKKRKTGPKPKAKPAKVRSRSIVTVYRKRGECNHMQDGEMLWHKSGFDSGRQRYRCPSCKATGHMQDGAITEAPVRGRRVAEVPADIDAFLAEIAAAFGTTTEEMLSKRRLDHLVQARRTCVRRLRERNYSFAEIGDALSMPRGTVAYLLEEVAA